MEKYAQLVRESLVRNGLEAWAEVRSSPLEPVVVGEQTFSWYSTASSGRICRTFTCFSSTAHPAGLAPVALPAFPLLAASLAEGAVVALDDTQRADEREVGKSWLQEGTSGVQLVDQGVVGRTWLFRATRTAGGVHPATAAPQAPM